MCEDCGRFYDKLELIVADLYNYQAKPRRFYNNLDHYKKALGAVPRERGEANSSQNLRMHQSRDSCPEPKDATAVDVNKTIRRLKLTK